MNIQEISAGNNPPHEINVVIEIPQGSTEPVKYELDKKSGALFVDRFLHTAMFYPANYGFVPHTLALDGDPIDVLVICHTPVVPGAVIRSRPIGVLMLSDENGQDEKIIAVPVDALHPYYRDVAHYEDLPPVQRDQIAHFFSHYKDLESGKWVSGLEWQGPESAVALLAQALERYSAPAPAKKRLGIVTGKAAD
ncbi:MAG: inorganic diphosphatase [Sphingomonas bacterium]